MRRGNRQAVRAYLAGCLAAGLVWSYVPAEAEAQVPLDGFFPMVGMGLTDEFIFDDLLGQNPIPSDGVSGSLLGAGGTPFFDLALLDTGAGLSLVTDAAFDRFGLGESGQGGGSDGYRGTQTVPIGGATGMLTAAINDPLGLYASGLQDRTGAGAALAMNTTLLQGQTNTSTLTFPPESDLPNVIGLPFASQYATSIRNDQPQVFELEGRTVRAPAIEFLPLGSGGGDIARKAPLSLDPGAAFTTAPGYFQNILNIVDGIPVHENPQLPTGMGGGIASGGLFLDTFASNDGMTLGSAGAPIGFFFDTGASVTVLSEASAATLGFDVVTDEPEFTISVLGSGGFLNDIPGFFLDQLTLPALGGAITATNVPVIVLDVTDVSDPGNVVPGILGTNLLAGRNVVIDPNPSIGAGGESAGVYISDPVTTDFTWDSSSASADWSAGGSWDVAQTPDLLSVTEVRNVTPTDQRAVVNGEQEAWTATVGVGAAAGSMTVEIASEASLTVFSGVTVEAGGAIELVDGVLDAQFVNIRGGRLAGSGQVKTGSGPIEGQVEALDGTIDPEGRLEIGGRLSLGDGALLSIDLGGDTPGAGYDQIVVDGSVALDGLLEVSVFGFLPDFGQEFDVLIADGVADNGLQLTGPDSDRFELIVGAEGVTLRSTVLPGDINEDGTVDLLDLDILGMHFDTLGSPGNSDLNGDGLVDLLDLDILGQNFERNIGDGGGAAIPEPATAMLLMLASLAFRRRTVSR